MYIDYAGLKWHCTACSQRLLFLVLSSNLRPGLQGMIRRPVQGCRRGSGEELGHAVLQQTAACHRLWLLLSCMAEAGGQTDLSWIYAPAMLQLSLLAQPLGPIALQPG